MIGEHTGKQFRLGDEVTVKVAAVKPEESAIDFELVGMKPTFHRARREAPKVIHAKKPGTETQKRRAQAQGQSQSKDGNKSGSKKKYFEDVAKKKKRAPRKRK